MVFQREFCVLSPATDKNMNLSVGLFEEILHDFFERAFNVLLLIKALWMFHQCECFINIFGFEKILEWVAWFESFEKEQAGLINAGVGIDDDHGSFLSQEGLFEDGKVSLGDFFLFQSIETLEFTFAYLSGHLENILFAKSLLSDHDVIAATVLECPDDVDQFDDHELWKVVLFLQRLVNFGLECQPASFFDVASQYSREKRNLLRVAWDMLEGTDVSFFELLFVTLVESEFQSVEDLVLFLLGKVCQLNFAFSQFA